MAGSHSRLLKQVRVTGGPQWALGLVGWYDEPTHMLYFYPQANKDQPTATTGFDRFCSEWGCTWRALTSKEKESHGKDKSSSDPDNSAPSAFR